MLISWSGNVVTSTDEAIDQSEKTKSSVMADVRWLSPINLYWGDNTVFLVLIFIFGYWFPWFLVFHGVWLQLAITLLDEIVVGDKTVVFLLVFIVVGWFTWFFIVFIFNSLTLSDEIVLGDKKRRWSISYYSFKWVEHSKTITAVSAEGGGAVVEYW